MQSIIDFLKTLPGIRGLVEREHSKMMVRLAILLFPFHSSRYEAEMGYHRLPKFVLPAGLGCLQVLMSSGAAQVKLRASINKNMVNGGEQHLQLPKKGLSAEQIMSSLGKRVSGPPLVMHSCV